MMMMTMMMFYLFIYLFIYVFIYLQNLGCNTTTAKAKYTKQNMHTWLLKDKCVATYIAPIK